jgi:C-terminal processing protease CtpA/Prc
MRATAARQLFTLCLPAACVVLFTSLPAVAKAQRLDAFDRKRIETMLERVRDEISDRFYDSTFHGVDLRAAYDSAAARIQSATAIDRALAAVAQFTLDLHDSHTFFVPPQRTVWVEYGWDMAMVGDTCFVVYVSRGSDAEHQGVLPGDIVLSLNGYPPTRDNLWQLLYLYRVLQPQRSLHAVLRSPGAAVRTLDIAAAVHERKPLMDLTGVDGGGDIARLIRDAEKAEEDLRPAVVEYGGEILIWKLPTFAVPSENIRSVLKRARQRKTLVLDLRGNSGGPVGALLALVGQFSRDSVILGIQRERHRQTPITARGAGDNAFGGQLLVLVDSRSASASEILARGVQLNQRGRVLGDRTAGAVMRGNYRPFMQGVQIAVFYGLSVTDADLVMSDGGRLEGVGVLPDELILPTASDLAAGRDPVLARAVTLAGAPLGAAEAGVLLKAKKR